MQDISYDEVEPGDSPRGPRLWAAFALKWAGALLSLALVVMIVLWVYRLGVRDAQDIPVIQAMERPARVQPENPGGTQVPNQGLEVNEILGGDAAQNPRETRLAPATLSLSTDDTPAITDDSPPGDAAVPGDLAQSDSLDPQAEIDRLLRQALGLEEPEAVAAPAAQPPLIRPRSRPQNLQGAAVAPATPVQPIDPATLPTGTLLLQLGSFLDTTQAEGQWERLLRVHTDLLGTKQHFVQRAEQNGRVFFRLRVAGFEDENAQTSVCEALKARALECLLVTLR